MHSVRTSFGAIVAIVLLALAVSSCANYGRISGVRTPSRHLIFNPAWTGIPTMQFERSVWPATAVYDTAGESIEYRATVLDQQGLTGRSRDYLRRSFHSVRTGRARR